MTEREKKISELASSAEVLVDALGKLKERLNSFEVAEKSMDSVASELNKLIEGTATQVQLSNKLLESASEMGIIEITKQIQDAVEQISKIEKGANAATETLAKVEEVESRIDSMGSGLSGEIGTIASETSQIKSQLSEVSETLSAVSDIELKTGEVVNYLQGVSKFLESNNKSLETLKKSLEAQKKQIEAQQSLIKSYENNRKESETKAEDSSKSTNFLLRVAIGLSLMGIILNLVF